MLSADVEILIHAALEEDVGSGDITTSCTVPPGAQGKGRIVAKESLVLAGIDVARQVFWAVNSELEVRLPLKDGSRANEGDLLLQVTGDLAPILTRSTARTRITG